MTDGQVQATTEAAPAAAPTSEPTATPLQVTDGSSYAALVKSRFLEAQKASETAPAEKARDGKGRFQPRLVETPAEPEQASEAEETEQTETPAETEGGEGEAEEQAAETPAEPPTKQQKLAELARRVEAERTKRKAEAERKAAEQEFARAQPIVRGLATDKVKTVDELMSDAEFEALCDRRIARLNGQPQQSAEAQAEAQKIRQEVDEARRAAAEARGMLAKLTFQKQIDRVASKSEGYDVARDWCETKGQTFAEVCADVTETVFTRDRYWMSPEQARDTVIAFVLNELQTAESVSGKRAPAPAEAAPTSQKTESRPKRKTLNSTLKGSSSRAPDIRISGKESYAEYIKQKLRAGK